MVFNPLHCSRVQQFWTDERVNMSETGLPAEFVNPPSKIVQRGQFRMAGPKCRAPFLLHRLSHLKTWRPLQLIEQAKKMMREV